MSEYILATVLSFLAALSIAYLWWIGYRDTLLKVSLEACYQKLRVAVERAGCTDESDFQSIPSFIKCAQTIVPLLEWDGIRRISIEAHAMTRARPLTDNQMLAELLVAFHQDCAKTVYRYYRKHTLRGRWESIAGMGLDWAAKLTGKLNSFGAYVRDVSRKHSQIDFNEFITGLMAIVESESMAGSADRIGDIGRTIHPRST